MQARRTDGRPVTLVLDRLRLVPGVLVLVLVLAGGLVVLRGARLLNRGLSIDVRARVVGLK